MRLSYSRHLRWINLAAFILNVVIVYLGSRGVFGKSNKEVSDKYPTLITPSSPTFLIWIVIFALEALMSLASLFEYLVPSAVVVHGLSAWWAFSCLCQALWSLAFTHEMIVASMVLIGLVWVSLGFTMMNLHSLRDSFHRGGLSYMNFASMLLVVIPLSIHFGWVTAASSASAAITVAESKSVTEVDRIVAAMLGIGFCFAVAFSHTFVMRSPDPFTSLAIAWAFLGISDKLLHETHVAGIHADNIRESFQKAAEILAFTFTVFAAIGLLKGIGEYFFGLYKKERLMTPKEENLPSYDARPTIISQH